MEKYYNIKKTSEILGIKTRTIREWIRKDKIKAVKYPGCSMWFIPANEIVRITGELNGNKD